MQFDLKNQGDEPLGEDYLEEYLIHDGNERKKVAVRRLFYAAVVATAIVVFSIIAVYAYRFAQIPRDPNQLETILADTTPYKTKPEDPGGMKIPNTDKEVYNSISGEKALPEVKRILPGPEEPMIKAEEHSPSVAQGLEGQESAAKERTGEVDQPHSTMEFLEMEEKRLAEERKERGEPEIVMAEEEPISSSEYLRKKVEEQALLPKEDKKEEKVELTPLSTQDIKKVEEPKKETASIAETTKTFGKKEFRIQLGAFKSEGDAMQLWKTIAKANNDLLTGKQPYVEKADLEKGVFYRLKAGPFDNESEARQVCSKLIDRKQGCFFAKE